LRDYGETHIVINSTITLLSHSFGINWHGPIRRSNPQPGLLCTRRKKEVNGGLGGLFLRAGRGPTPTVLSAQTHHSFVLSPEPNTRSCTSGRRKRIASKRKQNVNHVPPAGRGITWSTILNAQYVFIISATVSSDRVSDDMNCVSANEFILLWHRCDPRPHGLHGPVCA